MTEDPVGRILVERRFLDVQDCDACLGAAREEDRFLEEVLIREERFSRGDLLRILENEHFCPAVDLEAFPYDPAPLVAVPRRLADRHLALPIAVDRAELKVAFSNPRDARSSQAIGLVVSQRVSPLVALRHEIRDEIASRYDRLEREIAASEAAARREHARREPAPDAPDRPSVVEVDVPSERDDAQGAVAIVDRLLDQAIDRGATDIHLEPKEDELVVRFRMDGVLFTVARLPAQMTPSLVSRVKILGGMDIAERRLPQDGRHTVTEGDRNHDLRISSIPTPFGEKVVLRLLGKRESLLDFRGLGMSPPVVEGFSDILRSPQGLYLVTGPTGSGKTTTLYATLNAMDCESVNVVTLEDPIEYRLPSITQVQVHEEIGLTFAAGLRAFLRQDPDVILIGEIRDATTVEIACRGALTGHKVLSTIHTNDAAQAVPRLVDMGVPAYLIAATLKGVLAQRLVRVLCPECKEPYEAGETDRAVLGVGSAETLHRARGCPACSGTGYRGRVALFEYLPITENIVRLIFERASPFAVRHAARQNGMVPLAEFARRAVLAGRTTIAEIQRAVLADEGREQLCRHCGQVVSLDFAVCPFCQHVLKEKCQGCGHPLDPDWAACPSCGRESEGEMRRTYCPHCEAPVTKGQESCPFCGGGLR